MGSVVSRRARVGIAVLVVVSVVVPRAESASASAMPVIAAATAPGVAVALGYADSATGLTPWSGSANTTFIGEPPQCCATHGPDNGSPGYDSGAIEVTNTGASRSP